MEQKKVMVFAVISGIIILAISITVAYISFHVLQSSAEASLQNWKLGGAFAGFVFTASLLTSIIFQFYKQLTNDSISKYKDQIHELQTKLIKGTVCPPGFTIELDERHKLVFTRPQQWVPLNGVLYQYVERNQCEDFNANFNVIYQSPDDLSVFYEGAKLGTFDPAKVDADKMYEIITTYSVQLLKEGLPFFENDGLTKEIITVDDTRAFKWTLNYTTVKDNNEKIKMCVSAVYIYVTRLSTLFEFTFTDNEEDYLKSSEVFNAVIRSIRFL